MDIYRFDSVNFFLLFLRVFFFVRFVVFTCVTCTLFANLPCFSIASAGDRRSCSFDTDSDDIVAYFFLNKHVFIECERQMRQKVPTEQSTTQPKNKNENGTLQFCDLYDALPC